MMASAAPHSSVGTALDGRRCRCTLIPQAQGTSRTDGRLSKLDSRDAGNSWSGSEGGVQMRSLTDRLRLPVVVLRAAAQ